MRFKAYVWLLGVLVCAVASAGVAAPAWGAFGAESFFAANCKVASCNKAANPAEELEKAEKEGYSQAAGHPPFGITDFKLKRVQIQTSPFPAFGPEGNLKHLRIDVAPGVSTNPEAVPKCPVASFTSVEVEPVKHIFAPPACAPNTIIGENQVTTVLEVAPGVFADAPLSGKVYNLEQPNGLSSYFGVALEVASGLFVHTFIEGHIEWGQQQAGTKAGDYHDYFEINNITPGLLESRLVFKGNIGTGGFLTNPSVCAGPGPLTTTTWHGESYEGAMDVVTYTTPIGPSGCDLVPFEPGFALLPATKQADQPDGFQAELTLPHDPDPEHLDNSQLKQATVTLPEGMTLNPAAAQGLEACTPAQARIHSEKPETACPSKSEIGTVKLEVPDLPPGSLNGKIYLGGPESGPILGPPYVLYLDAESPRYGISVRLRGEAKPNEASGQVTTVFPENPEQPFSDAIVKFKEGALAPVANPLVCGSAKTATSLVPYTGTVAKSPFSEFVVDSDNKGGACPSPLPFALGQSTSDVPTTAAANANFTLDVGRSDGQQYLRKVSTTLPAGLVGKIPAVPLCGEPQATTGGCPAASEIGTASVAVGSGPTPVGFSGPVYLTGPTEGAPYGMTIVIHAAVGPFDLGPVVTRARINIDPFTARVTVSSPVRTIVAGVPLRLKTLSVDIKRQGFLINPTNCGLLSTETLLTSTFGSTQLVSTAFQASNCAALPFKPRLTASTNAKASRKNGAALTVKVGYPKGAQANIKSVVTKLPRQLPSRLSTLKLACPEATFDANPFACPRGSRVGGATALTPVLPKKLTGPAFFVSHGGAAFPDLDLVMVGNGVETILVGKTNITKGVTTTTFAAVPDVPVSAFELRLPQGNTSALAANGSLCAKPLYMPTTITGQNGKVIRQKTRISVSGCGVRIVSHRVRGGRVFVTVLVPSAGRLSIGLHSSGLLLAKFRRVRKAGKVTLSAPLSLRGLRAHRPLRLRVRVGFVGAKTASVAFAKVTFR